jgi:hypothetical protein
MSIFYNRMIFYLLSFTACGAAVQWSPATEAIHLVPDQPDHGGEPVFQALSTNSNIIQLVTSISMTSQIIYLELRASIRGSE